jgi:hypothetical protein
MSDLMIGYYLVSGALFLFLVGSGSIICDMILNKEKQIVIRKPKNKIAPPISDDDFFDT